MFDLIFSCNVRELGLFSALLIFRVPYELAENVFILNCHQLVGWIPIENRLQTCNASNCTLMLCRSDFVSLLMDCNE